MEFRSLALAGAALVAMNGAALAADLYAVAPGPISSPVYQPQSMVTGDASIGVGYFDFDSDDGAFIAGDARVNIPLGGGFFEELEVTGLADLVDDGYSAIGGFSHTYYKNEAYALGFVLGGSSLDGDGAVSAGVEGVVFLPSVSWVGQAIYTWGSGSVPDFWTLSGEARWYWDPNTKFSAIATYADWNSSWMFTLGAEHRYDNTPFSLWVSASYFSNDDNDGWEAMLGARWAFDQPGQTLQGHDYEIPFAVGRTISF